MLISERQMSFFTHDTMHPRHPIPLLFCLLALVSVRAQERPILDNMSFSAGMGYTLYRYEAVGASDAPLSTLTMQNYQITFAKMIQHSWGMRVQYLHNTGTTADNHIRTLHLAHFDFLWSISNTFFGPNPNRRHNLYGFYGLSLARSVSNQHGGDNDFSLLFGLRYEVQLKYGFFGFLEEENLLLPPDFDRHSHLTCLPLVSAGLAYRFVDNPYRYHRSDSQQPGHDWFFSTSVGLNSLQYRGIGDIRNRMGLVTPAVEFSFGKNFSSFWTGRLQWSGLQIRSKYNASAFFNIHADLMLNLSNVVQQANKAPRFSIYGYGGAGSMQRQDSDNSQQFAIVVGLLSRYTMGYHSDFYIDFKYALTPPRFAHVSYNQSAYTVGVFTLTTGYAFNIGQSDCRNTLGTLGW